MLLPIPLFLRFLSALLSITSSFGIVRCLLSLGLPEYPLKATIVAGVAKLALAFPLVPRFGYVAEAVLLSLYYITSVGAIVLRGVKEIRARINAPREG